MDKTHQHSNKPVVQPLWISRGGVGSLYELTQQLWAALSAVWPGVRVQYMCPVMHMRPHWHLEEGPYDTSAQEKRLSMQMAAIGQQARHYTLYSLKRGGLQWLYYTQQTSLEGLHALSGIKTRDVLLRYLDPTAHRPV